MKPKRIIILLVLLAVVGMLAAGIWWYVRRDTGPRLLVRARLKMRAQKYDEASELAARYAAKYPRDWRGYYYQAQASIFLGRYDKARAVLETVLDSPESFSPKADVASCRFLYADTYGHAARQKLRRGEDRRDRTKLAESIRGLKKAVEVLQQIQAEDEAAQLDANQTMGLYCLDIARSQDKLIEQLKKEADRLEQGGDQAGQARLAAQIKKLQEDPEDSSKAWYGKATALLMDVVRRDPSRELAARRLIETCVLQKDDTALAEVTRLVDDPNSASPVAASVLKMHQLGILRPGEDQQAYVKRLKSTGAFLEDLLENHPEKAQVRVARARVALRLSTFEPDIAHLRIVKKQLDAVLADNAENAEARLLRAQMVFREAQLGESIDEPAVRLTPEQRKQKMDEAERALFDLRTDESKSADAHYAYAQVALATGKRRLAVDAMRAVTEYADPNLSPDVLAFAHRFMAIHLLDVSPADALGDATKYYKAAPDSPDAVRTYATAAAAAGQVGVGLAVLAKAETNRELSQRPEMLMAVAHGYSTLGDKDKADCVANKAANLPATSLREVIAKASALLWQGKYYQPQRSVEAERLLQEQLKQQPDHPGLRFVLGQVYRSSGRMLQARENLRASYKANPGHVACAVALAETEIEFGELERAAEILQQITARTPAASVLRLKLQELRGKPLSPQDILESSGDGRIGLAAARNALVRGDTKACIDGCKRILAEDTGNFGARWLLGRAHLGAGQITECVVEWEKLVTAKPNALSVYSELARVLAQAAQPTDVRARLKGIRGAVPELADMAVADLLLDRRQYAEAADAFGRLTEDKALSPYLRGAARLRRATSLMHAGQRKAAIADLDLLAENPEWRARALLTKVAALLADKKPKEAEAILAELFETAKKAEDEAALLGIAGLRIGMGKLDAALAACDAAEAINPKDTRVHVAKANIHRQARRLGERAKSLRRVIELQPQNYRNHLALCRTYEEMLDLRQALTTLEELAGQGETAKVQALYERAALLTRWGLHQRAVKWFEQLAALGHDTIPQLQLNLGQAFYRLGKHDRARKALERVPVGSRQYLTARLLMVDLVTGTDMQLAVLDELDRAQPDRASVLARRIGVLQAAGRADEAIRAFASFIASLKETDRLPPLLAMAGMEAMIKAGNHRAAFDAARRVAERGKSAAWSCAAALLAFDADPEGARSMLPKVEESKHPFTMLVGLCASVATKDKAAAKAWLERMNQLDKSLTDAGMPPVRRKYVILAALAAGEVETARKEVARLKSGGLGGPTAARLEVAAAAKGPAAAGQAARLILADVAAELRIMPGTGPVFRPLGKSWAMGVLKARPTSQWAALLAVQATGDEKTIEEVLAALEPTDSAVHLYLTGVLHRSRKEFAQAAEAFGKAAEKEQGSVRYRTDQAMALERSGKEKEAAALYHIIWQATKDPVTGNNYAFLCSRLYPKDSQKLAAAAAIAAEAVKAQPRVSSFLDTKAWLNYLLGKHKEALQDLRRAVLGLPASIEVHYHLGLAERKAGDAELGLWHLEAVVDLAREREAKGKLPPAEANVLKMAKAELAAASPKKP